MNDFRFAIRVLLGSPAFSLAALLVLALGLGANGAVFALVDAVLLKPLPVADPDRLVVIASGEPRSPRVSFSFSYPAYKDLRDGVMAFREVLACSGVSLNVTHGATGERVRGEIVTGDYFQTLGVGPFLGRLLTPADDQVPGGNPVTVLDYGFWQRLGGDPGLVGSDLLVNGHKMRVVGVTPPDFYGIDLDRRPAIRVPMSMATVLRPNPYDPYNTKRGHQWLTLMARLKPGLTLAQASAEAGGVFRAGMAALADERPAGASEQDRQQTLARQLELRPGAQGTARLRRGAQLPILLLAGATITLLLVACANLGNLLLARGAARQHELGVRLALGAGRWRIFRQLLAESVVLAIAGGAAGVLVAAWTAGIVLSFLPPDNALGVDLAPGLRVVAGIFALSLVSALLFGLVPAWRFARQDPADAIRTNTPTVIGAEGLWSLRSALVVAQVALSFMLLAGAGLFLRTLANLRGVDTGFAREHVLVAAVDPSLNGYDDVRARQALTDFLHRVEALPGVTGAGLSSTSPISGSWDVNTLTVPGYQAKAGEEPRASVAAISPGYFEAMGMPMREGRGFSWRDADAAPLVAVINETMAREYFPGTDPVGRHFFFDEDQPIQVIGVVRDAKYVDLREDRTRFVYRPFLQVPVSEMALHARTAGDPLSHVAAVRDQLRAIDSSVPLYGVTTLERQIDESLTSERILSTLGTAFGVLALLLAGVGVYGVLAFSVARRTREIGVRMALGAGPADAARLILSRVGSLLVVGLILGTGAAVAFQGAARSLLFGTAPGDPRVLGAAALLVALVAGLAAWFPTRRAARLDPLTALRRE